MPSYELRFPATREGPLSSVFFRGDATAALRLAQRSSQSSELIREGRPLCAIELDRTSGYWVITSLVPVPPATAAL